jgi:peptidoglycan/LPS O-acetylase OafA/YrhL
MARSVRFTELDGLRGIAALSVATMHLTSGEKAFGRVIEGLPNLSIFQYGIQLFFIISGFVIMMSLSRMASTRDFFVARAARLFPAYWTCLAFTVLVLAVLSPALAPSAGTILANATMMQRWLGVDDVDGSYWTLFFEMNFYLIMAGLHWTKLLPRLKVICLWVMLATITCLAVESATGFSIDERLRIALMLDFSCFFVAGIMLYLRHAGDPDPLIDGVLGLSLVAVALARVQPGAYVGHLSYVALAAGFILVIRLASLGYGAWLNWAPLQYLGGISYALYLIHQYAGFQVIRHLDAAGLPPAASIALTAAAMLAVATLVRRLVERPAQRWLRARFMSSEHG